MKFSIRTALLAILLVSIGCSSLIYAGQVSKLMLSTLTLLAFMMMAVVAFVGSGKTRAMSVGYVVCSLIYGILLMLPGHEPLDSSEVRGLPTTAAMQPLYQFCQRVEYKDAATGKMMPNYVPKPNEQFVTRVGPWDDGGGGGGFGGGGGGGFGGGGGVRPTTIRRFVLSSRDFMFNAQLLWTIIFGIFGAVVASCVWKSDKSDTALAS